MIPVIALMALMGAAMAAKKNQEEDSTLKDIGGGYKAYQPKGISSSLGNIGLGAGMGALGGLINQETSKAEKADKFELMDKEQENRAALQSMQSEGQDLLQQQAQKAAAERETARQTFDTNQNNTNYTRDMEKQKLLRAQQLEDYDRTLSVKQGDNYQNLRSEAAKSGAELPYGPLAPEYIQNQTAKANATRNDTKDEMNRLSAIANLNQSTHGRSGVDMLSNINSMPLPLDADAGSTKATQARVLNSLLSRIETAPIGGGGGTGSSRTGSERMEKPEKISMADAEKQANWILQSEGKEMNKDGFPVKPEDKRRAASMALQIQRGGGKNLTGDTSAAGAVPYQSLWK